MHDSSLYQFFKIYFTGWRQGKLNRIAYFIHYLRLWIVLTFVFFIINCFFLVHLDIPKGLSELEMINFIASKQNKYILLFFTKYWFLLVPFIIAAVNLFVKRIRDIGFSPLSICISLVLLFSVGGFFTIQFMLDLGVTIYFVILILPSDFRNKCRWP